jgi:hypothetical protein
MRLPIEGFKLKRESNEESTRFKELPVSMRAGKDLENAFNLIVSALRSFLRLGANDRPSVVALVSFPDVWSEGRKNESKNWTDSDRGEVDL